MQTTQKHYDSQATTQQEAALKKMGLFSVFCMAIGTIVGAGIFGNIPVAANYVGSGIILAYICAFLAVIARYLPLIIASSVLPSPYSPYMHVSRLLSPALGFIMVIYAFNYILILCALATVFAEYFNTFLPIDTRILGVAALIVFTAITCLGAQANAITQNIMVVLLIAALLLYTFRGMPHVSTDALTMAQIFSFKGISITAFGSAVGVLSTTLQGAADITSYSEEINNPGKTIPLAFTLSTFAALVLFLMVSAVSIGVVPVAEIKSLKDVAVRTLSSAEMTFFILAGAVFAILTSLNGIFIACTHMISTVAADQVVPEWFDKRNKFNVAQNSVLFLGVISVAIVAFGLPVGVLFTTFSFLTIFSGILLLITPLMIHKAYPNLYKHAYLKLTPTKIKIICALGLIVSIWQSISLIISLDFGITAAIAIWVGGWYLFYFIRKSYLKKRGVDLDAVMSTPYPEWVKKEEELARLG